MAYSERFGLVLQYSHVISPGGSLIWAVSLDGSVL